MKTKRLIQTICLLMAMPLLLNAQNSFNITNHAIELIEGGKLIYGNHYDNHLADYYVIRLDDDGSVLWERIIGGNQYDELAIAVQTKDGGFILGGRSNSDRSDHKKSTALGLFDYWIVKLNAHGTVEWDQTYGGYDTEHLVDIIQHPEGGYLLAGYSDSRATLFERRGFDFQVIRTNDSGGIIWDKRYGTKSKDVLTSLTLLEDGGVLLAGQSFADDGNNFQVFLTDQSGAIMWEQKIEDHFKLNASELDDYFQAQDLYNAFSDSIKSTVPQ